MNDAGQYVDSSSYIENARLQNEELEESPSYADKAKKAVATTVTIVYAATQLSCAAISYHFSEEGKLYRQLDEITTWTGPKNNLTREYEKFNKAINDNKYNLDSLKVYKKAAEHLTKTREALKRGAGSGSFVYFKKYQEVRRNPSSVLGKPRSKLTSKKPQASK